MIPNPSATQYDWPFYAAQFLSATPDWTVVPQGYAYDFTIEPAEYRYMWWGMIDRMYGPASMNAHCN